MEATNLRKINKQAMTYKSDQVLYILPNTIFGYD